MRRSHDEWTHQRVELLGANLRRAAAEPAIVRQERVRNARALSVQLICHSPQGSPFSGSRVPALAGWTLVPSKHLRCMRTAANKATSAFRIRAFTTAGRHLDFSAFCSYLRRFSLFDTKVINVVANTTSRNGDGGHSGRAHRHDGDVPQGHL